MAFPSSRPTHSFVLAEGRWSRQWNGVDPLQNVDLISAHFGGASVAAGRIET
jgi:hypothetical protein